ncbi:hypothetical protein D9758_013984 [Tetrapyrgos nigripes]|uniref:triacylglycerol lipase n=1 Tax=Tetrapyrgos nigripes TaxID=182062 RepID=A0A8H5G7S3_9AGAR|nr:hypothetical protein D9758_013984 [Tetrapyrgos nigripes]
MCCLHWSLVCGGVEAQATKLRRRSPHILPTALRFLLASLISTDSPTTNTLSSNTNPNPFTNTHSFRLAHAHALTNDSRTIFRDFKGHGRGLRDGNDSGRGGGGSGGDTDAETLEALQDLYELQTSPLLTYRPPSYASIAAQARSRSRGSFSFHGEDDFDPSSFWLPETIPAPNVSDRYTLLTLAKMTQNTYFSPPTSGGSSSDWYDLGPQWNPNSTFSYGWEPDDDGFRGHVFVSSTNITSPGPDGQTYPSSPELVVLTIKGTSVPWIGGGPTMKRDKLNDNLLFSCCCARVGPTWSTVCPCYDGFNKTEGSFVCRQGCVEQALMEESLFYSVGVNLYNNLTLLYPHSTIWVTGHSLGGSLASLLGQTFGAPVVAFDAPGERMASRRLHLPEIPWGGEEEDMPRSRAKSRLSEGMKGKRSRLSGNVPIPLGQCTGVTSTCASAGYALESRCHVGRKIVYDTVSKLGWSSNVQNHPVRVVIDNILAKNDTDWGKGKGEGEWEGGENESSQEGGFGFGWPWGGGGKDEDKDEGRPAWWRDVPEVVWEDEDLDVVVEEGIRMKEGQHGGEMYPRLFGRMRIVSSLCSRARVEVGTAWSKSV